MKHESTKITLALRKTSLRVLNEVEVNDVAGAVMSRDREPQPTYPESYYRCGASGVDACYTESGAIACGSV